MRVNTRGQLLQQQPRADARVRINGLAVPPHALPSTFYTPCLPYLSSLTLSGSMANSSRRMAFDGSSP